MENYIYSVQSTLTENYDLKQKLLLSKGVALWDVLQNCDREGSSDLKIKNEVANDFQSFYNRHPSVKHVFFTSGKAETFYDTYIGRDMKVNFHNLPSPSSANTWKTLDEKVSEWKVILNYL